MTVSLIEALEHCLKGGAARHRTWSVDLRIIRENGKFMEKYTRSSLDRGYEVQAHETAEWILLRRNGNQL